MRVIGLDIPGKDVSMRVADLDRTEKGVSLCVIGLDALGVGVLLRAVCLCGSEEGILSSTALILFVIGLGAIIGFLWTKYTANKVSLENSKKNSPL